MSNLWAAPHLEFLPLLPRLLITTLLNVMLMAYVLMPLVTQSWLASRAGS